MEDDPHSDEEILEILKMKKVAVVGMSKNPDKAAHYVPKYLHENGYDITPVNPNAESKNFLFVVLKKKTRPAPIAVRIQVNNPAYNA